MEANIIFILIVIFWIGSLETLYIESCKNKDFLLYKNFKQEKNIQEIQLKYLYINLYLYLSQ